MQWTVKHACGHVVTHQIYGGTKNGQARSAWLATQPCLQCKRDAELNAALNANAAAGLPALTGSERQIAWAEQIRHELIPAVERQILGSLEKLARATTKHAADQAIYDACIAAMRAAVTAELDALRRRAEARWWIDHRSDEHALVKQIAEAGNAAFRAALAERTGKPVAAPAAANEQAEQDTEQAPAAANERTEQAAEPAAARPAAVPANRVDVAVTWAGGARRGELSMDLNRHVAGDPIFVYDDQTSDAYGPDEIDGPLTLAGPALPEVLAAARAGGWTILEPEA